MWATEKSKAIDIASISTLTTSGTAATTEPINPLHVPDQFIRVAATADAYVTVIPRRSGSFTLNPAGLGVTAAISSIATAAEIQTALLLKTGAGNVTVTGTGTAADPFLVTFIGTLALAARTLVLDAALAVNATLTKAEVTPGDGTHNEVFSLIFTATPVATSANGVIVPAGTIDVFRAPGGSCVSALQVTAAGKVSVAVVEP